MWLTLKLLILAYWVGSSIYVHYRGKVRHKPLRHATDHSSIFAPLNVFMYIFSKVPNQPYIPMSYFLEMAKVREQWPMILSEGKNLISGGQIKQSDKFDDAGFNSFFKTGWKRFYLKWYNDAHPSAEQFCPKTVALLRSMPNIKAAMFTYLPPGAKLVRHRDPYAGSLRYHLGLITPNDDRCYIDVDGELYSWRDGEDVMFDETYIHYASNETDMGRLIFFADVERPMKYRWAQKVNHFIGSTLLKAASSPNESGDKTGGINKIFKYLYKVRQVGKKLKAWNRHVYYAVKYLLFAAIIYLIFF